MEGRACKVCVDICGIPYEVVEVESNCRTDMSMGRSDSKTATITINRDKIVIVKGDKLNN